GYGSLAEALLFAPERGAAAVLGSNALTPPSGQSRLGNAFLAGLCTGKTLGEAFAAAQQACLLAGEDPDVLRSFLLLADPAAKY
ncbi:MAG: C25 family cysteine peptidase, partial [Planctomycetota bacterium]|nr:C25 family cysteine peptidase [Planctomycetota bacterium]